MIPLPTTYYPSSRNPLIVTKQVNLLATGDEVLVDLSGYAADARVRVISVTVDNYSIKGTLATAPAITIDDGTTGHNIVGSTTLTSAAQGQYWNLTVIAPGTGQPYVVVAPGTIRLHKATVGNGQATATVARENGIATITTGAAHGFSVGDYITVKSVTETGFNDNEVQITSVPGSTSFTYLNPGPDLGSTADTSGRVGAYFALVTVVAV